MNILTTKSWLWGSAVVLGLAGCAFEGLIAEGGDTDHLRPRTTLLGTVEGVDDLSNAEFEALLPDGTPIEIFEYETAGNTFNLSLAEPDTPYTQTRLSVTVGQLSFLALVPSIDNVDILYEFDTVRGLEPTEIEVSLATTFSGLALVAKTSTSGRGLTEFDPTAIANAQQSLIEEISTSEPAQQIFEAMETLVARVDPQAEELTPLFQWPTFADEGAVRSINSESPALEDNYQFPGSIVVDVGSGIPGRMDNRLLAFADEFTIPECVVPEMIKVVLEVNFTAGRVGAACGSINRFAWVSGQEDDPDLSMFFVGGIQESSPIQDSEINAQLGTFGANQTPNSIPMYDDGTNGDREADDGVWTITFDLPRNLRIGYKYTWGQSGDLWTGTEEWPGNTRILELIDTNDDNIFYRQDNFGDETSNKNRANTAYGDVEFNSDNDNDGIPDARERHDLDNNCEPDEIITPTGIGPVTVPPNEDGTCPI